MTFKKISDQDSTGFKVNIYRVKELAENAYMYLARAFRFEGRIWDLIVSVPDHCLSFYFVEYINLYLSKPTRSEPNFQTRNKLEPIELFHYIVFHNA